MAAVSGALGGTSYRQDGVHAWILNRNELDFVGWEYMAGGALKGPYPTLAFLQACTCTL